MIADPPSEPGADQNTVADPLPGAGVKIVGAPGAPAEGVALALALAVIIPDAVVATTVKSYDVPLVRPVIVAGDDVAPLTATPSLCTV